MVSPQCHRQTLKLSHVAHRTAISLLCVAIQVRTVHLAPSQCTDLGSHPVSLATLPSGPSHGMGGITLFPQPAYSLKRSCRLFRRRLLALIAPSLPHTDKASRWQPCMPSNTMLIALCCVKCRSFLVSQQIHNAAALRLYRIQIIEMRLCIGMTVLLLWNGP